MIAQQNKLHGNYFASIFIDYDMVNGVGQYHLNKKIYKDGVSYSMNVFQVKQWGIGGDFYKDFLDQLNGGLSISDLRAAFGMHPRGGPKEVGFVLRSKSDPRILAHVHIEDSQNREVGCNPNTYNVPCDIMIKCFCDISHLGSEDYRSDEETIKMINLLASGGMKY